MTPSVRAYAPYPSFEATPPGAAPGPPLKTGARVSRFRGCNKLAIVYPLSKLHRSFRGSPLPPAGHLPAFTAPRWPDLTALGGEGGLRMLTHARERSPPLRDSVVGPPPLKAPIPDYPCRLPPAGLNSPRAYPGSPPSQRASSPTRACPTWEAHRRRTAASPAPHRRSGRYRFARPPC